MGQVLDAVAPIGGDGQFPLPNVVQSSGPGLPSYTSEGPSIDGIPMPGQWLLTKATREYGWQKLRAVFMNGATVIPTGDPPMDIEYTINIWESGTMGFFLALLQTMFKKGVMVPPGSGAVALPSAAHGIHDPVLKTLGVTSVVVASVDPPLNPLVSSGGKGPWVAKIKFIEYRLLKPAPAPPDQTIPDNQGPLRPLPTAGANLATASAAVGAGAASLQGAAAQALVPPR